ncbi:MAG: NAD-dependent epimerase/dehydratase family protein [Flavobacteriales bacterium]|jgi:nucleoside-diphosphate-sugar epimerase|nr:NAD-dependent epimerase/dehydratase family protein [Flavobacteriales bacterium]
MDLVTGATGIVGTHLLLELLREGRTVRALRRGGSDASIVDRVFHHYGAGDLVARIEWAEADIQDVTALADAMDGVEHVYHAAALVSFDPRKADALHAVNVQGTANLVNAALEAGVKRLCHVSSTAAIGAAQPGVLRDESMAFTDGRCSSEYARSKHLAELEVHRGIAEGLDAVIVNPSVIIGPGLPGRSSMTLIERLRSGTRWYTTGSNAFVDARDVAACMRKLMDRGVPGERYLLVGANARYKRLFELAAECFGQEPPVSEAKPWMLALAWRAERMRSLLTGSSPLVTKATVSSALSARAYSNAKVDAVLGHQFLPLEESVANAVSFAAAG